jgi:hypothetical protein
MEKINYSAPYFNKTDDLRKAYQLLYPNYDYDMVSVLIVGALSVYVPSEKFDALLERTMSEATAKLLSKN